MPIQITSDDLLLVIDPQIDFCPGGNLAVPEGDLVLPMINQLATRFQHVILTQDWHPAHHSSFASSHSGHAPYEMIQAPYGLQTLWPDHCIQGSAGAEFHPGLHIPQTEMILRKGFRREIDSYSAFLENDKTTPTGLAGYLRERGLGRIFLVGLAYDYCVRYSATDGQLLGFECHVIEDACRAIDLADSVEVTNQEFAVASIQRLNSSQIL